MQVARMRLGLDSSGIAGKLRQIGYALLLERHYDKQDILEAYLNLAPYGGNVEGIEAASRIYFGKSAARLTALESCALTVIPQNPVRRDPVRGPDFDAARLRLHRLLAERNGEGTDEAPRLRVRPISSMPFKAPHLCAELLAEARAGAAPGRIVSTIEPDLQAMLESCLASFTERGRRFGLNNASALLVHTPSMRICALAGSADFFEASIQGQVDGTRAKRSPGSTLKPFIYALALEQGLIHPMTLLIDSPRSFGGYDPENFDKGFRGPVHAHDALKASRNLPAIILAEQLSEPGLYGFLQRAQVRLPMPPEHYGLALVLGGAEVTMRELASLYAMLANQGLWHPLRLRQDQALGAPRRLLSPEVSYMTLRMLEKESDTLRTREGILPLRYKTGTSNGFRDAWTAGLVGEYALVVWAGNFDGTSHPYLVGGRTALPLFRETAQALGTLRTLRDPLPSQRPTLNLVEIPVCTSTGDVDISRCTDTTDTMFIPGVSPIRDSGILRPILIDRATGQRACEPHPSETEEVFWEFWPSDVRAIFAQAGIAKPQPPDWLPVCRGKDDRLAVSGRPPRIILPKKNMTYYRSLDGQGRSIPLSAAADPGVSRIHWFAGASYLGSAAPGEPFLWEPEQAGELELSAVDDRGRSTRQICRIQLAP
jgi:penicillin-binding protein 1C